MKKLLLLLLTVLSTSFIFGNPTQNSKLETKALKTLTSTSNKKITLEAQKALRVKADSLKSLKKNKKQSTILRTALDESQTILLLDSVILKNVDGSLYGRYDYKYDTANNLLLEEEWLKDTATNSWLLLSRDEYDSRGEEISCEEYEIDEETGKRIGKNKTVKEFDKYGYGQSIFYASYTWDTIKNDWYISYKAENEYYYPLKRSKIDDEEKTTLPLKSFINHSWDEQQQKLLPQGKGEFKYGANSPLQTSAETYSWDNNISQWVGDQKREAEFDSKGRPTLFIGYEWKDNQWVGVSKVETSYEGNRRNTISYEGGAANGEWLKASKEEAELDANEQPTSQIDYNWLTEKQTWIPNKKTETEYTGIKQPSLALSYAWENDDWVSLEKTESKYNTNGSLTSFVQHKWDSDTKQWIGEVKEEYSYTD